MKILMVEDDFGLANGLSYAIRKQGYELTVARTSREAADAFAAETYDLVLLDVSLPDGNGFALCEKIRQSSEVPLIFLTAADEETDMIMGLDIGADDYITKPFKLSVLLARIHAILRRSSRLAPAEAELHSNGITVRLSAGEVYKNGSRIDLTASEYKLLCMLMEHPDTVLSPDQILCRLWDCDENYVNRNTLTVYIRRLRTKIEDRPGEPKLIQTVRGMGYKWNTEKGSAR